MDSILVTGGDGQLGMELRELSPEFQQFQFFFTDRDTLDITNFQALELFIKTNKITVIINCAAYTNVDGAEEDVDLCNAINNSGVGYLAQLSKKYELKLVHISTDYVFEGTSFIPYLEDDSTNPKNEYGRSKLLGEEAIKMVNPNNSVIIRTAWLYSEFGHNFVKTMLRISKDKEAINVVNDQIGSPTYALDLASTILKMIPLLNAKGVEVYHFSNSGKCSWFEFATEILKIKNNKCKVLPIASSEFKTKAYRPAFSLLNTEKISNKFQLKIPNWQDSLKACLLKLNS